VTFAEVWDRAVERDPGALFLRYAAPDGTVAEWSYGAFDRALDAVASRLAASGVRPGRAVHMALANGPAFVAVWLASVRLGAPLALAALGETISERAGVINIGLEGSIIGGALGGALGALLTGSPGAGVLAGAAAGWPHVLQAVAVDHHGPVLDHLVSIVHGHDQCVLDP